MARKALITGITGQDGAYLSELLLAKGYEVYGSYNLSNPLNAWRLTELRIVDDVHLISMDLSDQSSVKDTVQHIRPDEIYNLAAHSFGTASFDQPVSSGDLDGLSVARLLAAIHMVNPKIRFFQASTSEMFGKTQVSPQCETTPFYPRSPYGVAKLYGHWITTNYREAHDFFACSAILFNHESPLRGLEFVTRKITAAFAAIHLGQKGPVELGDLSAQRDWGFAGDYVEGMWLMLQQSNPEDYVLATGTATSIRKFAELTAEVLNVDLVWKGAGKDEIGLDRKTNKIWVKINPLYSRRAEANLLVGDSSKANSRLGWRPKVPLEKLVGMMVESDLRRIDKQVAQ
jgi:GDPmannose 4,6-dehydratase